MESLWRGISRPALKTPQPFSGRLWPVTCFNCQPSGTTSSGGYLLTYSSGEITRTCNNNIDWCRVGRAAGRLAFLVKKKASVGVGVCVFDNHNSVPVTLLNASSQPPCWCYCVCTQCCCDWLLGGGCMLTTGCIELWLHQSNGCDVICSLTPPPPPTPPPPLSRSLSARGCESSL